MKQLIFILFVLGMMFVCHFPAGADIEIPRSVVASGGGKMSNGSYIISSITVGQSAIGTMSGPSYTTDVGFCYSSTILIGVESPPDVLPFVYRLDQNYPNPFNPVTTLEFSVAERSRVRIALYDVTGRVVKEIVAEDLNPGPHWVVFYAAGLASGVHFSRMAAGNFVDVSKFVLLR